jgi:hypothetical protein
MMNRRETSAVSSDVLLAWINHRLEAVSETQHRLAVERMVLQEQATRLRLGVPAADVEGALLRAGIGVPAAARAAKMSRAAR